jgi:hypothetical protein
LSGFPVLSFDHADHAFPVAFLELYAEWRFPQASIIGEPHAGRVQRFPVGGSFHTPFDQLRDTHDKNTLPFVRDQKFVIWQTVPIGTPVAIDI